MCCFLHTVVAGLASDKKKREKAEKEQKKKRMKRRTPRMMMMVMKQNTKMRIWNGRRRKEWRRNGMMMRSGPRGNVIRNVPARAESELH